MEYVDVLKLIESVQMRLIREVECLESLSNNETLRASNLFFIEGRILRAILLKIWKLCNTDTGLESILDRQSYGVIRGFVFNFSFPFLGFGTELQSRYLNFRRVR